MNGPADGVGPIAPDLAQSSAYLGECVDRGQIAGAVALVAHHDDVVRVDCVGLSDREGDRPMQPDTMFRLASMTKPIVSVAALMLVEAGRLQLDDPVARYVPDFANATVLVGVEEGRIRTEALGRPITVFDLLTHTSGIAYDPPHPALAPTYDDLEDGHYLLPELMRRLASHPLAHQPGAAWTYGWSHDVLGRVIEVVADQALDDYLAAAIFSPLGMVDSGFHVPAEQLTRLAAVYASEDGSLDRVDGPRVNEVVDASFPLLMGGGGTVSTGPDYLRFLRMLLRGGELDGARLLERRTVAQMTRNQLAPSLYPIRSGGRAVDGEGYGLGVGVIVEPSVAREAGSAGTFEWSGAFDTSFWADPANEVAAVFMVQVKPPGITGLGAGYWRLVHEALAG